MNIILVVVTVLSIGIAGRMTLIARRALAAERRRSEARVRALATGIRLDDSYERELDSWQAATTGSRVEQSTVNPESTRRSRAPIAVVAGGLIVGAAVMLAMILPSAKEPAVAGRASTSAPLELVALAHERSQDGFVVRGMVHNPANGQVVRHLVAVIQFLDQTGAPVTNSETAVDAFNLEPGGSTRFSLTVRDIAAVERYRVSFRTDHMPVPHVDKRDGHGA